MIAQNARYADAFVADCERAFGFLVAEHGFVGPVTDWSMGGMVFVLYYKGTVGVECEYEERDDNVSVKVVRIENGRSSPSWRVDDTGVVVREHLTRLLLARGVRDVGFGNPTRPLAQMKVLEGFARMLKLYAPDVLAGSTRILDDIS
jgi:hypothetical protein